MLIGLFQVCAKKKQNAQVFGQYTCQNICERFFLSKLNVFNFFFIIIIYSEHLQLNIYIWCELLTDSQYDWNTVDTP